MIYGIETPYIHPITGQLRRHGAKSRWVVASWDEDEAFHFFKHYYLYYVQCTYVFNHNTYYINITQPNFKKFI
jgi:hypothetical protein